MVETGAESILLLLENREVNRDMEGSESSRLVVAASGAIVMTGGRNGGWGFAGDP